MIINKSFSNILAAIGVATMLLIPFAAAAADKDLAAGEKMGLRCHTGLNIALCKILTGHY